MTEKRRLQLWALRDKLVDMHKLVRWDQAGVVGKLVAKQRQRLERLTDRVHERLAA